MDDICCRTGEEQVLFDGTGAAIAYNHAQTHFSADAYDLALLKAIYTFVESNGHEALANLSIRVVEQG